VKGWLAAWSGGTRIFLHQPRIATEVPSPLDLLSFRALIAPAARQIETLAVDHHLLDRHRSTAASGDENNRLHLGINESFEFRLLSRTCMGLGQYQMGCRSKSILRAKGNKTSKNAFDHLFGLYHDRGTRLPPIDNF
jgi:hypothetical protein